MTLRSRMWHRSGSLVFVPEVDAAKHAEIPDRYRWASYWAGSLEGKRVADVGCWTGRFLEHLAAAGHPGKLFGIDLLGPWLEEATARHPEMEFVPVESLLIPIEGHQHSFDTVFFLETLEHLPRGLEWVVSSSCRHRLWASLRSPTPPGCWSAIVTTPTAISRDSARRLV
jgi:2-polyprenyl-3-methyl-5-hydroxy-6-metoxy-1,4-benzoquinol methylase